MAAVGVVQVCCPECDVAVPITTEDTSRGIEGNVLIVSVEPDLADVIAHAWTHETPTVDRARRARPDVTDLGGDPPPGDLQGSGPYST